MRPKASQDFLGLVVGVTKTLAGDLVAGFDDRAKRRLALLVVEVGLEGCICRVDLCPLAHPRTRILSVVGDHTRVLEHHFAKLLLVRLEVGLLALFDVPPDLEHERHDAYLLSPWPETYTRRPKSAPKCCNNPLRWQHICAGWVEQRGP